MKLEINVEPLLVLKSKSDWIRKLPNHLPEKKHYGEDFLFIDKNGDYAAMGEDFSAAEKLDTYPITVYRKNRISNNL